MSRVCRFLAAVVVASLVVTTISGWALATAYAPSTQTAWASVVYIQHQMLGGSLVRALHHFGAHVTVAAAMALLGAWVVGATYRRPRHLRWLLLLAGVGLLLAFAVTGNVLPWDEGGYWGARTEMGVLGMTPVVGERLARVAQGGSELGQLALTRMYALHVTILPAIAVGLFVAWRSAKVPAPEADAPEPGQSSERAWAAGGAAASLVMIYALVFALGEALLDAPAASSGDGFPARPEWYFRPLNQLLSSVGPRGQGVVALLAPLVLGGLFGVLPWLDRVGGGVRRLVRLAPVTLVLVAGGALLAVSLREDAADADHQAALVRARTAADHAIALARAGVPPEGPLAMLDRDPPTRAARLFAKHCATCHRFEHLGPEPGEDAAPDLTGFGTAAWAAEVLRDPDGATRFGKTPFAGNMPSFTKPPADPEEAAAFTPMSDVDLEAVTAFLASQSRGDRAEGSRGEAIIRERCTSCHRLDGETDDEDALGPELRGWASVPWIEAQIADPASGRAYPKGSRAPELEGHMPAFEAEIEEADRSLLARWILGRLAE